jgi:hypothetical protein
MWSIDWKRKGPLLRLEVIATELDVREEVFLGELSVVVVLNDLAGLIMAEADMISKYTTWML